MSLLSAISELLHPAPPPSPLVAQALQRTAEIVDPMIVAMADFERQLAAPLEYALGYCDGLVASVPGPIDINHAAFGADPLVHALFATADDITQMLGRSQAVRDYLSQPASLINTHFYALLAARRQQKHQLGMAIHDGMLQTDVPQTVLFFSDQTLVQPHSRLEDTLQKLRDNALDSLLLTFRDHIKALRAERDGLRADLAVERAHATIVTGSSGEAQEVHTRHLLELELHLRQTADALMPEQLLHALATFLHTPESSLSLKPVHIVVDRLGIISDGPGGPDFHTLDFPELKARDRRHYLVMLARISCEEARAAIERVSDQQHRFMFI